MGFTTGDLAELRAMAERFFDTKVCVLTGTQPNAQGALGKPYTATFFDGKFRQTSNEPKIMQSANGGVHVVKPWEVSVKWDSAAYGGSLYFDAGTSTSWLSEWAIGTTYAAGACVFRNDKVFIAKDATTGNDPDDSPTHWREVQLFEPAGDNRSNESRAKLTIDLKLVS
jgi:hypothetical protein